MKILAFFSTIIYCVCICVLVIFQLEYSFPTQTYVLNGNYSDIVEKIHEFVEKDTNRILYKKYCRDEHGMLAGFHTLDNESSMGYCEMSLYEDSLYVFFRFERISDVMCQLDVETVGFGCLNGHYEGGHLYTSMPDNYTNRAMDSFQRHFLDKIGEWNKIEPNPWIRIVFGFGRNKYCFAVLVMLLWVVCFVMEAVSKKQESNYSKLKIALCVFMVAFVFGLMYFIFTGRNSNQEVSVDDLIYVLFSYWDIISLLSLSVAVLYLCFDKHFDSK